MEFIKTQKHDLQTDIVIRMTWWEATDVFHWLRDIGKEQEIDFETENLGISNLYAYLQREV